MPVYVLPVCETAKETQMYRTVFWTISLAFSFYLLCNKNIDQKLQAAHHDL